MRVNWNRLLSVLIVTGMLFAIAGCGKGKKPEETVSPTDVIIDNSNENETVPEDQITVTYFGDDGTILKYETLQKGEFTTPPSEPKMSYGKIFRNWDFDFSPVQTSTEINPVCISLPDQTNAFVIPGVYGKTGDTVMVPVLLCGNVCVAGFDITVSYDPEKLEIVSVDEDGAVVYNDETPGQVRINYVSVENTVTDVDVVRMMFCIKSEPGEVEIGITVNGIYACNSGVDSNDDSMYVPESYIQNGAVFVIP